MRDNPATERGHAVPGDRPHPLAGLRGARPPAPDWFTEALAMPVEERRIGIEGAELETLAWGDPAQQGLVLAHGSMAHARWWQPVAQLLARRYRVVAFSFAGMGGSDRRPAYAMRQMGRELVGVAEGAGLFEAGRRPAIVAHSFGGKAASFAAASDGGRMLGAVMVDTFSVPEALGKPPPYKARFYASQADALERFRLSPDEPAETWAVDAIARGACVERDGRWTWRFDPDFFGRLKAETDWNDLVAARCPLAFIRGEHSTIALREDWPIMRRALRPDTQFIEIAQCYHHIMAQQPIALAATIQAIVEGWRAHGSGGT